MTQGATVVSVLVLSCRVVATGVFAAACAHKLRDARAFVRTLAAYRVLPEGLVTPAAALAIALEGGVVIGLWVPGLEAAAAAVGAALLIVYGLAISVNLARGRRDLDCGCSFGRRGQPIGPALVMRNGVLVGVCGLAAGNVGAQALSWGACSVALACGAGLLLGHRIFETLQSNAPAIARLAAGRR